MDLRRALPTLVACLALGAFGAGCGSDDDEESGGSNPAPAEQPSSDSGSSAPAGKATKAVKVDMKDTTYAVSYTHLTLPTTPYV